MVRLLLYPACLLLGHRNKVERGEGWSKTTFTCERCGCHTGATAPNNYDWFWKG